MDAQSSLQHQNKVRRLGRLSLWIDATCCRPKSSLFVKRRGKKYVCVCVGLLGIAEIDCPRGLSLRSTWARCLSRGRRDLTCSWRGEGLQRPIKEHTRHDWALRSILCIDSQW
jgi:hypothetical protein